MKTRQINAALAGLSNSEASRILGLSTNGSAVMTNRQEFKPLDSPVWGSSSAYIRYSVFKKIGETLDGIPSVFLIAKYAEGKVPFTGIAGDITILRGGESGMITYSRAHVGIFYGYTNKMLFSKGINDDYIGCGRFRYNGEEYIGLSFGYKPTTMINFSGVYSTTCIFKTVALSEVEVISEE